MRFVSISSRSGLLARVHTCLLALTLSACSQSEGLSDDVRADGSDDGPGAVEDEGMSTEDATDEVMQATDAVTEATDGGEETTEGGPQETDVPEVACTETPQGAEPLPSASGPLEVELGARDSETGIDFLPLDENCSIPIGGLGQAGLTARLALRTRSDEPLRDAYAVVTLVNFADPEREPAPNNGPGVPRRFDCRQDGWCYLVPLLIEISHLNRLPDLEGTVVTFSAEVTSVDDSAISGSSFGWGRFVLEDELDSADAGTP